MFNHVLLIDVSEKGYAGGSGYGTQGVYAGYGPGGGYELSQNIDCVYYDDIGGGGYGGRGGSGSGFYSTRGGDIYVYGGDQNPQKEGDSTDRYGNYAPSIFGSGGAGGIHEKCEGLALFKSHIRSDAVGGRGGGSVIVKANKISIAQMSGSGIVANGGDGVALDSGGSGGGSGGMIYLEAASFAGDALCTPSTVPLYNTGKTTNAGVGTVWAVNGLNFTDDVFPNRCPAAIIAYGGRPNTADSGAEGGGGGRISIQTSIISPSVVQSPRRVTVKVSWEERQQTKFLSYTTVLQDLASRVSASIGSGRLITSAIYPRR